ncbi:MAG: hydroxyacylglutathione hydrolase [Methylococcaceae bacterium]|nr:MAG: hydroxyacylglutathione hydrolase [Methylococcaceae bacterium]
MLHVEIIPVLGDNYSYLLHDPVDGDTAVIDPAEAEPVLAVLKTKGWGLDYVLNTHHHGDHTAGNLELRVRTGCRIAGAQADKQRIPGLDTPLSEGDTLVLGSMVIRVLEVPGHTRAHLAFWLPEEKSLFSGDTLFSLGCGRLFEGTAAQMWSSLLKLANLPGDTQVYCAHEYTEANGRFALSVEPGNAALLEKLQQVKKLRAQGLPSVPFTLADELAANPFLRPHSAEIRANLGLQRASDAQVFTELRRRKDQFNA